MKYLKKFETETAYNTFKASQDYITPNVSLVTDDNVVYYNPYVEPPHDYSQDYLTLVALEDGTFSFYLGDSDTYMDSISYSIDNGETWVTYDGEERDITALTTPTITTGNKVLWKGIGKAVGDAASYFESTGRFNAQGNIMSLLYGDNFADKTQFDSEYQYQLNGLFMGSKVVDTNNLILPAITLTDSCYNNMFNGCTSLTTTPELPATTLADSCYGSMFSDCTSLTTAPELPATTLAPYCYYDMFNGCTSLNSIKCLATNISATNCTTDWVIGVAASGTFTKKSSMSSWTTGISGIPSGWTVEDAA